MEHNILDVLTKAENPLRPGDIAKELGIDSREVSKVIAALKKDGRVISPKRCYYTSA